jgi:hypothetical protein
MLVFVLLMLMLHGLSASSLHLPSLGAAHDGARHNFAEIGMENAHDISKGI